MNVRIVGSVFGFMQINSLVSSDLRFAVMPYYDCAVGEYEGYEPDELLTAKCVSEKYLSCDDAAQIIAASDSRDAHVREIIKQIEELAEDSFGADYYAALSFAKNYTMTFN
jgi:hypothetical protein